MKYLIIILISFIFISNANADDLKALDVCHKIEGIILHKMNAVIVAQEKWEEYLRKKIMHKDKTDEKYQKIVKKTNIWKDNISTSKNILKEDIYYLDYYELMCK